MVRTVRVQNNIGSTTDLFCVLGKPFKLYVAEFHHQQNEHTRANLVNKEAGRKICKALLRS